MLDTSIGKSVFRKLGSSNVTISRMLCKLASKLKVNSDVYIVHLGYQNMNHKADPLESSVKIDNFASSHEDCEKSSPTALQDGDLTQDVGLLDLIVHIMKKFACTLCDSINCGFVYLQQTASTFSNLVIESESTESFSYISYNILAIPVKAYEAPQAHREPYLGLSMESCLVM